MVAPGHQCMPFLLKKLFWNASITTSDIRGFMPNDPEATRALHGLEGAWSGFILQFLVERFVENVNNHYSIN